MENKKKSGGKPYYNRDRRTSEGNRRDVRRPAPVREEASVQSPESGIHGDYENGAVIGRNAVRELLKSERSIDKLLVQKGERTGSIVVLVAEALERGIPVIEAEKAKLQENLKESSEDENMSDLISIDDFDEVVIKIGQVLEAEKIEKSDKLLKLQVDIGEEKPRQIVAGLAKFYSPEELVDRKVCVVANLQPAKLFGTLSEGMILATGESGALLSPDENAEIGERIQ